MKTELWNVILALIWMAFTGNETLAGFVVGLVLGYLVLTVSARSLGDPGYGLRVPRLIGFLFYYLYELVLANLQVATIVLTGRTPQPAIIHIDVNGLSDTQITLLANLITMTPGTLSLDVSRSARTLYVHSIHSPEPARTKAHIEATLLRRVAGVVR